MTLDKNALEKAHAAVTHDPEVNISIYGAEAIIETYLAALPSVSEPVAWVAPETITRMQERARFTTAVLMPESAEGATLALYAHPAPSEPVSDGLVRFDGVTMTPAAAANRLAESAAAEAKIAELEHRSLAEGRPTHRHKKRGTEYVLIGYGKMQAESWFERNRGGNTFTDVDMREVAIYRPVDDGSLWARPREEFEDGRFEVLPQPPEAK